MEITLDRLDELLAEIYEDFQREEDQGVLQRDIEKATHALAGKDAIARIRNRIGLRVELGRVSLREVPHRRRA